MPSQTNEAALERAIEQHLTGTSLEALRAAPTATTEAVADTPSVYRGGEGYLIGFSSHFDAQYALDTTRFWDFLEKTQKEELVKLQRQPDWQLKILERLDRMLKKYGLIYILRHGLALDDAHLTLFYAPPLASSGSLLQDRFQSNQFSVTRQVHYSMANPRESIDMVLFINGLPFATMELKNPSTGQTAKEHGQKQYKTQRDISQPLLNFGRCVVHFAVDTEAVFMTTKLDGQNTFFLPFNKGTDHGAGNPPNPNGHKTSYLWQEILTKSSVANILQNFIRLDGSDKDPLSKRTLYFPRYHQLDVVRRLVQHSSQQGVGHTYLIQHSAGSGKSNSITWAAYQLIAVYPAHKEVPGNKGLDKPLFDSVIVVTDRRLLDKQLRDNIKAFSEMKNIIAPALSASELKNSLESGKKIIITTIQKFPFIIDGIADLSDKRFAVIIDEAHSSQSGTAAGKMNQAMGNTESDADDDSDIQDKILAAMQARKMRGNASYFAFTATPKNSTLEKFGDKQPDGSFKPFHLYTMKQAIEEGFILDVLSNYTTYKSYYEIQKSTEENPLFDTKKAQKKLKKYVETHEQTIAAKAEIIIDHFLTKVVAPQKLKGKAKAMVVTQDIEAAIRYFQALQAHLKDKGNPFKIIVAFSGKKTIRGIEYTEDLLNGFPEKDTRDKFDTDDYRILVVANKYLTGFDQPKLTAMYVDKKLQDVLAVQALSRLNRAANKLGKIKEDLFILDFFNTIDDIKKAFDPFYTATTLSHATDVNVLHELKTTLDQEGVYEWQEVEDFVEKYFNGVDAQFLSPLIDVAAHRFNVDLALGAAEKADYKVKAKQFVKIYGQMAAILPYEKPTWEKLFWFLKFLIPKLILKDPNQDALDELLNAVDLSTYGLERVKLNEEIGLDATVSALKPQNANPRGAFGGDKEEDLLDLIIQSFNERYFQGWDIASEDKRMKFLNITKRIQAHTDFTAKVSQNADVQNRDLAFLRILEEIMTQQRKEELSLYRLFAQDNAFKETFTNAIKHVLGL